MIQRVVKYHRYRSDPAVRNLAPSTAGTYRHLEVASKF